MQVKNIVLFDMDNTLVTADTVQLWSDFLYERGIIDQSNKHTRDKFHRDYIVGKMDAAASYRHEIATLKAIPIAERKPLRQVCFETVIKPAISLRGLALIQHYKAQADTLVLLITATISFLAEPVAHYAQVDDLIATQEEMANDDFTGHVAGVANIGSGKITRFNQWLQANQITPRYTTLYSDSINDLPLLNLVNKPIAVDPDEALRSFALKNHWDIISFKSTVADY